jgi:hypothetical protein
VIVIGIIAFNGWRDGIKRRAERDMWEHWQIQQSQIRDHLEKNPPQQLPKFP